MANATNGGGLVGSGMGEGGRSITGWRQTFSSLSGNRDFNLLFAGNVLFFFGMNTMIILRGWLVIDKWDNAALLGYLMATVALPMLLLAPIGGVITDRVDKRKLILLAQSFLVITNAIVAVLIITDTIEFWHLMIVSPITSASFALNMPARQALVAMLVPREKLLNATALSTAAMNASRIVGPLIGGFLIVAVGIGPAYVVSTSFYAIAAVVMAALPSMPPKRETKFSFFEDFVEGFSYIKRTPVLVGLLLFATIPMMLAMPYQILLPVFADRVWDVGEVGFAVLQGVSGVGGLIGALFVANLDSYPKKGKLLLYGAIGFGVSLILFALSPWFILALVFIGAIGVGSMMVMTVNNTAIQLIIPDEVRGRVMSVMMMSFGLMPLGAVPASVAAERFGAAPVVAISAVLFIAAVLAIFAFLPAFRHLDRDLEADRDRGYGRRMPGAEPRKGVPSSAVYGSSPSGPDPESRPATVTHLQGDT